MLPYNSNQSRQSTAEQATARKYAHGLLPIPLLLCAGGLSGSAVQHAEVELVSWKQVKDVTSDGGVIKKIIKESTDYKTATVESSVKVRCKNALGLWNLSCHPYTSSATCCLICSSPPPWAPPASALLPPVPAPRVSLPVARSPLSRLFESQSDRVWVVICRQLLQ